MKRRSMTLDLALDNEDPPARGDYLTTYSAAYRIVDVRPVESRVWPNRWRLDLERLPTGNNLDQPDPGPGHRCHRSSRYRPGETPSQFFGVDP